MKKYERTALIVIYCMYTPKAADCGILPQRNISLKGNAVSDIDSKITN